MQKGVMPITLGRSLCCLVIMLEFGTAVSMIL